jgi:hypothetical protein
MPPSGTAQRPRGLALIAAVDAAAAFASPLGRGLGRRWGGVWDAVTGEQCRRLIKRMPKPKALAAIERSILVIIFHMLADPTVEFAELGADHYTRRLDRARRTSQLQVLGYTVTLTTAA